MLSPRSDENVIKRRSRRRMAWISLLSMIGIVLLMMFKVSQERLQELTPIIDTLFFCLASVVLGYCGLATFDDGQIMKHHERVKSIEEDSDEEAKK